MGSILLIALGVYFFIVGRARQGRLYDVVDGWMGDDVARFSLTALGGAFFCVALLRMMSSAMV